MQNGLQVDGNDLPREKQFSSPILSIYLLPDGWKDLLATQDLSEKGWSRQAPNICKIH